MFSNKFTKLLIVGISGVTCGGKTTLATQLNDILPKSTLFSQDIYFRDVIDPLHVWVPELNHINFDIVSSLDMEKMFDDVLKYIKNNNFVLIPSKKAEDLKKNHLHPNNFDKDLHDKIKNYDIHILIIEGFTIFNYQKWLYLFNLKYYLTLDKEECYKRRVNRVYEPPDCPGYFEKVAWPEYLKNNEEVKESVEDVFFVDNMGPDFVNNILNDISEFLNEIM